MNFTIYNVAIAQYISSIVSLSDQSEKKVLKSITLVFNLVII